MVRDRRAVRRRLGLVFQETSVDGLLTVEENLLFAARLAGLGGRLARAAVADAIERAGLAPRARQPARQLSGGWRRLADIARATLHQPDLLILDEPTVGLDPEHREPIWSPARLPSAGRTGPRCSSPPTISPRPSRPTGWCCSPAGGSWPTTRPPRSAPTLGEEIAEIEGPGAERLARALRGLGAAAMVLRTERGLPRRASPDSASRWWSWPAAAPGIERFALRPTTLEDVYFARTQSPAAADVPEPA